MIHRIAILSDTHSLLRPEIREILMTCEVILHGGDIASQKVVDEIQALAPAYFVRGNADKEWAAAIPEELDITLFGFHIYMVHNKKHIRQELEGVDIVIYGHSHKYDETVKDGRLYLNPGSCGPRRFHQPITMMVMTVDEEAHTYQIEQVNCRTETQEQGSANQEREKREISGRKKESGGTERASADPVLKLTEKDMDKLIRGIIRDMNAGRRVEVIAERNHVEEEFVNQILQIYTTHPGIDVNGILDRMDIWGK